MKSKSVKFNRFLANYVSFWPKEQYYPQVYNINLETPKLMYHYNWLFMIQRNPDWRRYDLISLFHLTLRTVLSNRPSLCVLQLWTSSALDTCSASRRWSPSSPTSPSTSPRWSCTAARRYPSASRSCWTVCSASCSARRSCRSCAGSAGRTRTTRAATFCRWMTRQCLLVRVEVACALLCGSTYVGYVLSKF